MKKNINPTFAISLYLCVFSLFFIRTNVLMAQDGLPCLHKQSLVFSAGLGGPNINHLTFKLFAHTIIEISTKKDLLQDKVKFEGGPVFHFRGEYFVSKNISLGLSINKSSSTLFVPMKTTVQYDNNPPIDLIYNLSLTRSTTSFLARMNANFGMDSKQTFYFGMSFGYRHVSYSFAVDPQIKSLELFSLPGLIPFGGELCFGYRRFFMKRFGFYTEFGLTKSFLQGGLTVNLF